MDALLGARGNVIAVGWKAQGRLRTASFGSPCPAAAVQAGQGLLCCTFGLQWEHLELRDIAEWAL